MAQYFSTPLKKGDMLRFYPDVEEDAIAHRTAVVGKEGKVFEIYARDHESGKRGMYHDSFFKWVASLPGNVQPEQILVNSIRPVSREYAIEYLDKQGKLLHPCSSYITKDKCEERLRSWESWILKVSDPAVYKAAQDAKKMAKLQMRAQRMADKAAKSHAMWAARQAKAQAIYEARQAKEQAKAKKVQMMAAKKEEMKAAKEAKKAAKEAQKVQQKMLKAAEKEAKKMRRLIEKTEKKAMEKAYKARKAVEAKEMRAVAKVQHLEATKAQKVAAKELVKVQKEAAKALLLEQKAAAKEQKKGQKKGWKVEKKEPMAEQEKPWSCPSDGQVYPWTYEGKNYFRNYYNDVWLQDGEKRGEWCGLYIPRTNSFNLSVTEPKFDMHGEYLQERVPYDGRAHMWDGDYSVWRPFSY